MSGKSKPFCVMMLALGLLFPFATNAETIVGTCYEPNGKRFSFENGEFREDEDGYSNSNPIFVFNSNNPEVLIESWQAGLIHPDLLSREELDEIVPPTASQSNILFRSSEVIHALYYSDREAYSTTLYLEKGIGIFTRVRIKPAQSGEFGEPLLLPMGATYKAKCTFRRIP